MIVATIVICTVKLQKGISKRQLDQFFSVFALGPLSVVAYESKLEVPVMVMGAGQYCKQPSIAEEEKATRVKIDFCFTFHVSCNISALHWPILLNF